MVIAVVYVVLILVCAAIIAFSSTYLDGRKKACSVFSQSVTGVGLIFGLIYYAMRNNGFVINELSLASVVMISFGCVTMLLSPLFIKKDDAEE